MSHGKRGDDGEAERLRVGARAPCPVHQRQKDRDEQYHQHLRYALREEHDAEAGSQPEAAERSSQRTRAAVVRHREAGEAGDLRDELVAAHDETEAADQEHRGERAVAAAVQLAPGKGAKKERQRHIERGGKPRRVVQRQRWGERERAQRGAHVVERRLSQERLSRERRRDPRSSLEHFVDDAERVRLVRLPRVMRKKTGQDPREAQDAEQ